MKKSFLFALLLLGTTSAYSAAVLDSVIFEAGRNDKSKAVYSYDANGRNNLITSYTWSANQWVYGNKTENAFDANGNITEVITSMWDNNAWVNFYRYLYTYDANNARTSMTYQGWNGTAWENSSRYTYKNREDGKCKTSVYYNWVDGKWFEADSNFYSYNAAGDMLVIQSFRYHHVESGYDEDGWVRNSYVGYNYNENGQLIQRLAQAWYESTKMFVNNNKYDYEYDEKGDMSHHTYSYWSNEAWKIQYSKDYVYNDAHLLTESIVQDCTSGTGVNSQKEEYTYDAEGNTLTEILYDWGGSDWVKFSQSQYFYHYDGSEAIDQINQRPIANSQKLIKDGQIYILRGDKIYTLQGQEVK